MKKIFYVSIVAVLLFSCNDKGGGSYTINGDAAGIADGTKVILQKQSEDGRSSVGVDTTEVKAGKFEFKGKVDEVTIHGIVAGEIPGMATLIIEKGTINFKLDKDTLFNSKASGTFNNEIFSKFNSDAKVVQLKTRKELQAFEQSNMVAMNVARESKDTVAMNKMRAEYAKIQKKIVDFSMKFSEENPKAYISLLIVQNLFNNPEFGIEEVKKRFDALDSSLKKLKPAIKIQETFDNLAATEVGKKAPAFSAKDPNGKEISLDDVLGKKVTIVDFWASWCVPCRQENPNMVQLYKDFHAKGLNMIGVSLDSDSKEWITGIAVDQLTWPQISNLKQWEDPIAKKYNVTSIPATFVLDADGKIVAKDIKGDELRKKIAELISK
jgi:peroxiredoxin